MKELKFETSKGEFVLVDIPEKLFLIGQYYVDTYGPEHFNLKGITEEQASDIVDYPFELEVADSSVLVFKDYEDDENTYTSSIDSLYSLLFSKDIHLFKNPYTNSTDLSSSFFSMQTDFNKEKEAEEKTFKNPHIFVLKWKEKSI